MPPLTFEDGGHFAPTFSCKLPRWAAYVERVDFYRGNAALTKARSFQMHPEGVFELIFQLHSPAWHRAAEGSIWSKRPDAFIGGLFQQNYHLGLTPESRLIALRLRRGAARRILPGGLHEFSNGFIRWEEVWADQMAEQLSEAPDLRTQLFRIEQFLHRSIRRVKISVIDGALDLIHRKNGMVTIRELEQLTGLSSAQFRRRFREEVGLSPKPYLEVMRVNAIIQRLGSQQNAEKLTALAYRFGYFDQAHFIHRFKQLTGRTPGVFLTGQ